MPSATTEDDIVDAVRTAREARTPLAIAGAGTKTAFGCVVTGKVLATDGLRGIVDYQPEELILTARPGTLVSEIAGVLAQKNQRLGFDPSDWGPLFGKPPQMGTIGGALSTDLNGPARLRYGAARDQLLGIRAVNGHGDAFKAGGKVVKNVTGFDIPKLACGAFGTLCVLSEVTLRVFPKPSLAATFAVEDVSSEAGLAVLRRVWSSPLEPTGLAFLPQHAANALGLPYAAALVRLEGAAMPLEEKRGALHKLVDGVREIERGDAIFARIGSGSVFVGNALEVWRVALPPSRAAAFVADLNPTLWYADWAGGLLWVGVADGDLHAHAARHEGHATLLRADPARRVAPFPPLSPGRLALTRAVKAAFDPLGLFNPGRMGN